MCKGTINRSFQYLGILAQLLEQDGVEFTLDPTTRRFASPELDRAGLMGYLNKAQTIGVDYDELMQKLRTLESTRRLWQNLRIHEQNNHMPKSIDWIAAESAEKPKFASAIAELESGRRCDFQRILTGCTARVRDVRRGELKDFLKRNPDYTNAITLAMSAELRETQSMEDQIGMWTCELDVCMSIIRIAFKCVLAQAGLAEIASYSDCKKDEGDCFLIEVLADKVPALCRDTAHHQWVKPNAIRFVFGFDEDGELYFSSVYPIKKEN